jgi:hypothetical protein
MMHSEHASLIETGPEDTPLAEFELNLDSEAYSKGDLLIAKLRNVTNQGQSAGNKAKYDIQYRGPNGWHTIIGVSEEEDFGWTVLKTFGAGVAGVTALPGSVNAKKHGVGSFLNGDSLYKKRPVWKTGVTDKTGLYQYTQICFGHRISIKAQTPLGNERF